MAARMSENGGTMTAAEVLQTLFSQADSHKAEMDSARGEMGAFIKDAEERFGINRKAFKAALALKRMEAQDRSAYLQTFRHYCDVLGFNDQADLFAEAPKADQPPADAGAAQAAANAEAITKGIKPTRVSGKTLN
ncbi:hypothetical protein [Methylobacterium nodulans]|uniref:Uncharacterized protein n=1 Tax=Methylobacterium nodulans (strain LMG 21967 / CNCM I-2342 / ORS 2060) TaxID=460265 RepID=B8IIT0_METNO|nr:hypothetical protein [Methylobacterium nodulans]ACL61725.1 conserved hypothetical protein [Methylobacterium nodulans ORS 2060]